MWCVLLLLLLLVSFTEARVLYANRENHHHLGRELLESETRPVFVLKSSNPKILSTFQERKDGLCSLVPCVVYTSEINEDFASLRIAPGKEIKRRLANHGSDHVKNAREADVVFHDMTRRALGKSLLRNGDGSVPIHDVNLLFVVEDDEIPARRKHACESDGNVRCVIVPPTPKNRALFEQFGISPTATKKNVMIKVREGKVQRITV